MLTKPFLALCSDWSKLAKTHPSSGTTEEWFSNVILRDYGLTGVTFDFLWIGKNNI